MKRIPVTIFAVACIAGCATTQNDDFSDEQALAAFRQTKETSQRWRADGGSPESLADIGFSKHYKVVYLALWEDGGSTGYLLRDRLGVFFAVCRYQPRRTGQGIADRAPPVYYIGALYPMESGAYRVAPGSSSEKFVRSLCEGT